MGWEHDPWSARLRCRKRRQRAKIFHRTHLPIPGKRCLQRCSLTTQLVERSFGMYFCEVICAAPAMKILPLNWDRSQHCFYRRLELVTYYQPGLSKHLRSARYHHYYVDMGCHTKAAVEMLRTRSGISGIDPQWERGRMAKEGTWQNLLDETAQQIVKRRLVGME